MSRPKICVLGAGVVGLTTCLKLLDEIKNAEVTLIAEKFNTETTSDGAAGLFCPFSSFQASTPELTNEIVKESYVYYENLRTAFGVNVAGVTETSGFVLSNLDPSHVKNPLIEKVVPEYRVLLNEEWKQYPVEGDWKYGSFFRSLMIQTRIFLPWALKRFQSFGGKVVQKKISSFEELIPYNFDIIVNCTGFGSHNLCQDKNMIPIRGQVLKVSAPLEKHFILADNDVYIIPGFETTLGGTRNYGNYDETVDKHISAQIWEKCTTLRPSLKDSPVIRGWTGLRPHRVPVRLETEVMNSKGVSMTVVHNYGHGAQGVTTAPGSAKIATELVKAVLQTKSKI